jgi:hypothetical protein
VAQCDQGSKTCGNTFLQSSAPDPSAVLFGGVSDLRDSCSVASSGFVRGDGDPPGHQHQHLVIWQLSCAVAAVGDMQVQHPPLRVQQIQRTSHTQSHRPAFACSRSPIAAHARCDLGGWVGCGKKMELSGELQGQLTHARRGMIRWVSHGPPRALVLYPPKEAVATGSLGKGHKKAASVLCYATVRDNGHPTAENIRSKKTVPCIRRLHCLVLVLSLGVILSWFHVMKDE